MPRCPLGLHKAFIASFEGARWLSRLAAAGCLMALSIENVPNQFAIVAKLTILLAAGPDDAQEVSRQAWERLGPDGVGAIGTRWRGSDWDPMAWERLRPDGVGAIATRWRGNNRLRPDGVGTIDCDLMAWE